MVTCPAVRLAWDAAMRFGKRQNLQLCELSKVLRCGPADRWGAPRYAERRKVELVFTGTESPLGRLDWPTSATESTEWRFWGGSGEIIKRCSAQEHAHSNWMKRLVFSLTFSLSPALWCALGNAHTHTVWGKATEDAVVVVVVVELRHTWDLPLSFSVFFIHRAIIAIAFSFHVRSSHALYAQFTEAGITAKVLMKVGEQKKKVCMFKKKDSRKSGCPAPW